MINTWHEDEPQAEASAFGHPDPEPPALAELLRLVVIRENRLRRLVALDAPEIVLRNERRMLRAAVNAVIANGGTVAMETPDAARHPGRTPRPAWLRLPNETVPETAR